MQIGTVSNTNTIYKASNTVHPFASVQDGFSAAVTKSETEDQGGEFLGLTMLPQEGQEVVYGMRAMLSERSTAEKPIVQVISNENGERQVYDVDLTQVDPEHATRLEMFALCSYADKYSEGTGDTFGSFHTLRMYEENARQNGCTPTVQEYTDTWEQFRTEKVNWKSMCASVMEILQKVNDPSILNLFSEGKKLQELFEQRQ